MKKVAAFFLVDHSKSLRRCDNITSDQKRIPTFLIALLQEVPETLPGWPQVGLAFFGEVDDPLIEVKPVWEISNEKIEEYQNRVDNDAYNQDNDYVEYLRQAQAELNAAHADENLIILISDGKMDERQDVEEARDKIRDWFGEGKDKQTRVVLFQAGCDTPSDDLSMWNDPGILGSFLYCDDSSYCGNQAKDLPYQLKDLIERTPLDAYLPTPHAGWWFGDQQQISDIPGIEDRIHITAIITTREEQIDVQDLNGVPLGTLRRQLPGSQVFTGRLSLPAPLIDCADKGVSLPQMGSETWGYYFYTLTPWDTDKNGEPIDILSLIDLSLGGPETREIGENTYRHWNNSILKIRSNIDIGQVPFTANELASYTFCYEIRVYISDRPLPRIGKEPPKSLIPPLSIPLEIIYTQLTQHQPLEWEISGLSYDSYKDVRVIVDLVRKGNTTPIERQELSLQLWYYPVAIPGSTIRIQYGDAARYYPEGTEFHIYALTRLSNETMSSTVTQTPGVPKFAACMPPRDADWKAEYEGEEWHAVLNDDRGNGETYHFADLKKPPDGNLVVSLRDRLTQQIGAPCDYQKLVFQWENTNGSNYTIVCNLRKPLGTSTCEPYISEIVVKQQ